MDFFKLIKQFQQTKISLKESIPTALCTLIVAIVIYNIWSFNTLLITWLLGLTSWAYIHIKKSNYTWQRFDDIDERDVEFRDEFEVRIEALEKQITELNSKLQILNDKTSR